MKTMAPMNCLSWIIFSLLDSECLSKFPLTVPVKIFFNTYFAWDVGFNEKMKKVCNDFRFIVTMIIVHCLSIEEVNQFWLVITRISQKHLLKVQYFTFLTYVDSKLRGLQYQEDYRIQLATLCQVWSPTWTYFLKNYKVETWKVESTMSW